MTPLRRRPPDVVLPLKRYVIDWAFARLPVRSFADLGGLWAVDGSYSFHALGHHEIERAYLVDEGYWTPATERRARSHPQLELVRGDFGAPPVRDRVGEVDAVLLFDVLLHQVAPDWDEVLALYAGVARCLCIVNPQWVGGTETVRLLDLGPEEYLASVPPQENHDEVVRRPDEIHPVHRRPYRDVHEIWQWGIRDETLVATLERLGFRQALYANEGSWNGLERFENHGFVFFRDDVGSAGEGPGA
jgi:hypothetical protein